MGDCATISGKLPFPVAPNKQKKIRTLIPYPGFREWSVRSPSSGSLKQKGLIFDGERQWIQGFRLRNEISIFFLLFKGRQENTYFTAPSGSQDTVAPNFYEVE